MTPTSPTDELPVVTEWKAGGSSNSVVAGVVLAAGLSSRFGEDNKLLAELDGIPLVRHATQNLVASIVDSVTVVIGYEAERVRRTLDGLPVDFVVNMEYTEGQAASVRAALLAMETSDLAAVLFALGDMPMVQPSSIDAIIQAYRAGVGDALAAAYEGKRGNPVLFDSRYFDELIEVDGDTGGRSVLLAADQPALIETGDPGVCLDVNTIQDLNHVE